MTEEQYLTTEEENLKGRVKFLEDLVVNLADFLDKHGAILQDSEEHQTLKQQRNYIFANK